MKYRNVAYALLPILLLAFGCGVKQLPTVPIEGKVFYQGKPLASGLVVLQPDVGPVAQGHIESNGVFRLSSYGKNDGAIVGKHRVRIVCREAPVLKPGAEAMPGKLLIPPKYADFSTSGLTVEVKPSNNEPLRFELVDSGL